VVSFGMALEQNIKLWISKCNNVYESLEWTMLKEWLIWLIEEKLKVPKENKNSYGTKVKQQSKLKDQICNLAF